MRFAAILCDLDGVLVDSGDAVEAVWRDWATGHGLDGDAVAHASHGVPPVYWNQLCWASASSMKVVVAIATAPPTAEIAATSARSIPATSRSAT